MKQKVKVPNWHINCIRYNTKGENTGVLKPVLSDETKKCTIICKPTVDEYANICYLHAENTRLPRKKQTKAG